MPGGGRAQLHFRDEIEATRAQRSAPAARVSRAPAPAPLPASARASAATHALAAALRHLLKKIFAHAARSGRMRRTAAKRLRAVRASRAAVDGLRRALDAFARVLRHAGDFESERRAQQQAIPVRAAIVPGEHCAQGARIVLSVAARQIAALRTP